MTLEQRLYNGDRAKEVLENEQFQAAFDAIETELVEQWKNSPARDEAARHELWLMLRLLKKLNLTLQGVLDDGKQARAELEHLRRKQEAKWSDSLADRARGWLSSVA